MVTQLGSELTLIFTFFPFYIDSRFFLLWKYLSRFFFQSLLNIDSFCFVLFFDFLCNYSEVRCPHIPMLLSLRTVLSQCQKIFLFGLCFDECYVLVPCIQLFDDVCVIKIYFNKT